ncbi:MAG: hypothetical protein H0Z38_07700 [Firmicutes bacterium]|nr:hypothetical protein [Bacillota bacterium]
MFTEWKFSEARASFTEVVDRAQRFEIPVIQPRKKSEDFSALLRRDLLKALLDKDQVTAFSVEFFSEDDGSVTVSVDPFGIIVNGETREKAIDNAVDDVIDYAKEYFEPENFLLYSRSPNRRSHLALVVKVLLSDSEEQVKGLLNLA